MLTELFCPGKIFRTSRARIDNPHAKEYDGAGNSPGATTSSEFSRENSLSMPAEIISVANQKGGVGKTTTSINLAAALARFGVRTLIVDLDPQGNTSSGLGFEKKSIKLTIYQSLIQELPVEKAINPTKVENLDIICSNSDLIGAEVELVSTFARENRLKDVLKTVLDTYKFIIIDCPPSLGLLTINALTASQKVIIPIQCEYYALEGLANFIDTMNKIKRALNQGLTMEGIVLTMYDARISLGHQVKAEIEKHFSGTFFKSAIPRNVRLAEAPSFGQSIFEYDPKSRGAEAYTALAAEILRRRGMLSEPPEPPPSPPAPVEERPVVEGHV